MALLSEFAREVAGIATSQLDYALEGHRRGIKVYESMKNLNEVIGTQYGDRVLIELVQNGHDAHVATEGTGEIDQPPAHDPMDRRDRAAFDYLGKRPLLHISKSGPGPQSLSIQQTRRAKGIEPHHPVPHDLQTYPADPRRRGSGAAVVYLGQRQTPPSLVRAIRPTRQSPQ